MSRVMSALLISLFAMSAHAGRPSVNSNDLGSAIRDPLQEEYVLVMDAIKEQLKDNEAVLHAIDSGSNFQDFSCQNQDGVRVCSLTFKILHCDNIQGGPTHDQTTQPNVMGSLWIDTTIRANGAFPGAIVTVDPEVKGGCGETAYDTK